jgi:hypothetical protein
MQNVSRDSHNSLAKIVHVKLGQLLLTYGEHGTLSQAPTKPRLSIAFIRRATICYLFIRYLFRLLSFINKINRANVFSCVFSGALRPSFLQNIL